MRRGPLRRFPWVAFFSGGALYAAASRLAGQRLAERLVSARGLAPAPTGRKNLLAALARRAGLVAEFVHEGSGRDPVELSAVFASVDRPAARPTILFLHGKGGNAAEWEPAAVRALEAGYNVLIPDLRGHGESAGDLFSYGLLEREDLANALLAARERYGIDPVKIGAHSCSAGSAVALAFAAEHPELRAVWLESPFAEPGEMARHYLSLSTGIPSFLLGLTARWAMADAVGRIGRRFGTAREDLGELDPLRLAPRLRAPVILVYGERDRLIPARFVRRLEEKLPPGSEVWQTPAGHCHHEDQAETVLADEYEKRWREFFGRHLPVEKVIGDRSNTFHLPPSI